MAHNWSKDGQFQTLLGVLKIPKNLAQPKKHGKNKATPFLNVFEVPDSESEVRISIKNLVLKLSNLMTLFVCNCTESTKKAQAHQGPGCPLISVITHLTKPWFDILQNSLAFYCVIRHITKTLSASFGITSPQLGGAALPQLWSK